MGKILLEIRGSVYVYTATRQGGSGEWVLPHCIVSPAPHRLLPCERARSPTFHTRSIRDPVRGKLDLRPGEVAGGVAWREGEVEGRNSTVVLLLGGS